MLVIKCSGGRFPTRVVELMLISIRRLANFFRVTGTNKSRRESTLIVFCLEPCEKLCVRYKQSSPRLITGGLLIVAYTLKIISQYSKGATISNRLYVSKAEVCIPLTFAAKLSKSLHTCKFYLILSRRGCFASISLLYNNSCYIPSCFGREWGHSRSWRLQKYSSGAIWHIYQSLFLTKTHGKGLKKATRVIRVAVRN